jgi:hypothetical protein
VLFSSALVALIGNPYGSGLHKDVVLGSTMGRSEQRS